jgi:Tfp pilus assembly protein PilX
MKEKNKNNGSVLLITIFVLALFSAIVSGMLQISTEEIQLMQNELFATEALEIAEAGLNDAFSELRSDSSWTTGFSSKAFNGGSYTVTVTGTLPDLTIISTSTSSNSYTAKVEAKVTVGTTSPYVIRIDNFKINES